MSLAGVRSSLGDYYQHCVALYYAVPLLLGSGLYQSIEVEVTSLDDDENPILVDDLVLRCNSGSTRYVQCKKNSPDHGEWTFAQLKPELVKAAIQLDRDPSGEVEFHSRSSFGPFASLRERLDTFHSLAGFEQDIPAHVSQLFEKLICLWQEIFPGYSRSDVFNSLRRVGYSSPLEIEDIHNLCHSQLLTTFANPKGVILSLLGIMTQASAKQGDHGREQKKHSFTSADLQQRLYEVGYNRSPAKSEALILDTFRRASSSGRGWPRTIRGRKILRSILVEIETAIEQQVGTILITDEPGSGKTCLLLDLLDALEQKSNAGVLFIQGRDFEACEDEDAMIREGIPADLPGLVERLANHRPVIVVIDSLDVLAIARNHRPLRLFLRLVDRLARISNVTVILACRIFDLKNEPLLTDRTWNREFHIGPLNWDSEIVPLLSAWGVGHTNISSALKSLLANPRLLGLFGQIIESGPYGCITTEQDLANEFLDRVVIRDPALGREALDVLTEISRRMLVRRRTKLIEAEAGVPTHLLDPLLSSQILIRPNPREIAFGHQTLIDVLAIRDALRKGGSLLSFLQDHAPVPFIRPSVRSFYNFLRASDNVEAAKQLRVALENSNVAFHLKRLLVESWVENAPTLEDTGLIRLLYRSYKPLFRIILARMKDPLWLDLLDKAWWDRAIQNRDTEMLTQFLWAQRSFSQTAPHQVLANWSRFMAVEFLDRDQVASAIAIGLHDFVHWNIEGIRELLELLVIQKQPEHGFLGRVIAKFVAQTNTGDDLLWRYIVHKSDSEDSGHMTYGWNLHCGPEAFDDRDFLRNRMIESETLLNLAIAAIEQKVRDANPGWSPGQPQIGFFLGHSSWRFVHHQVDHMHVDGCTCLMDAVEKACLSHAERNTDWWRTQEVQLSTACEGTLRYIHLKACTAFPETNIERIQGILTSGEFFEGPLKFELAGLIRSSFALIDPEINARVQGLILEIGASDPPEEELWNLNLKHGLLTAVPACLRTPEAQALVDLMTQRSIRTPGSPEISLRSVNVAPDFSTEELIALSDDGIVALIRYIDANQHASPKDRFSSRDLGQPLQRLAMLDPERAMIFIQHHATRVSFSCLTNLAAGIGRHLQMRKGTLIEQGLTISIRSDERTLAKFLLATMERHPSHWLGHSEGPELLLGISTNVEDLEDAERASLQLWSLSKHPDPTLEKSDSDHLSLALNSVRGRAAMAAIQLANHLAGSGIAPPVILSGLLQHFASDSHPAVRGAILQGLPYLQSKYPIMGWDLFHRCLARSNPELWKEAERSLYYAYFRTFDRVKPCLDRIAKEGLPAAAGAWGRISALACLSGSVTLETLHASMLQIQVPEAWEGVVQVFAGNLGNADCHDACIVALRRLLPIWPEEAKLGRHLGEMFSSDPIPANVPSDLIHYYLGLKDPDRPSTYSYLKWAKQVAEEDCDKAMEAMEILAESNASRNLHDHESLTAILTTLLREGEIRESSDRGVFLDRAIRLQDKLMELNVYGIEDWIRAAERA